VTSSPCHRIATRDDLPAIVAIYNETIPSRMVTADLEPVSVESRIAWFEAHSPDRHPMWVAERDGEVAAWLSYSKFHPRAAYDGTAEISLYVGSRFHRAGLGGRMLQEAIDAAPGLGFHTLVGLVFGHNAPSLALFERFGFARWGHMPRVAILDGVDRDLVFLGRRVDD